MLNDLLNFAKRVKTKRLKQVGFLTFLVILFIIFGHTDNCPSLSHVVINYPTVFTCCSFVVLGSGKRLPLFILYLYTEVTMIYFATLIRVSDGLALSASTDLDTTFEVKESKKRLKLLSRKVGQLPARCTTKIGTYCIQ